MAAYVGAPQPSDPRYAPGAYEIHTYILKSKGLTNVLTLAQSRNRALPLVAALSNPVRSSKRVECFGTMMLTSFIRLFILQNKN